MILINLRKFNKDGCNEFIECIRELRSNELFKLPDLNVDKFSQKFENNVMIDENRSFSDRLDLGEYLFSCFSNNSFSRKKVIGESNLWTWLAYIYFDQICPLDENKKRHIRETARYVCSSDYRNYYRHYIASSYDIYSIHRKERSRLFLYTPLDIHNDFIEQIASRQYLISNKNIVEVANILYWNNDLKCPKKGSQSRNRNGNLRRFVKIIGQLELTYDVYSMTSEEIIELLPKEFDIWKY